MNTVTIPASRPASSQEHIHQLLASAANGQAFQTYLQTHLAEGVLGAVAPRYRLDKAQTIQRLKEIFAMASGGSVTLMGVVEEGTSACARVLLTQHKHDLSAKMELDRRKERVVEAAIWVDVDATGHINQLDLIGDMLTPAGAMGMKMVSPVNAGEPA